MPKGIYNQIECSNKTHPEFTAQKHQAEVLDYFFNKSKHKGLLLFHRLGSGKSCSSILISDEMIEQAKSDKGKKFNGVFVLTPGSLRQNFIEEYCKRCGKSPEYLKQYYTFITTNYAVGKDLPDFNNSLVIIDEVHNLINGVKNKSTHFTLIYNKLMSSNCRILALTGTPIYNYIWEWPFLGNLLKPRTFPTMITKTGIDTESFMKQFTMDENGIVTPTNKKMFSISLRGIISYFPGVSGGFYPKVIHEKPVKILMTPVQDKEYWNVASWEDFTRMMGPPHGSLRHSDFKEYTSKMNDFIMASKYVLSRSLSNFFYPKDYRSATKPECADDVSHVENVKVYTHVPTDMKSNKKSGLYKMLLAKELEEEKSDTVTEELKTKISEDMEKNVKKSSELQKRGWVNHENFNNRKLFDIYSRKIAAVITNVIINWKAKHVVFTFFKNKSGVNMIHAIFKMCGIETGIYSGDISTSKRERVLTEFNAEDNRYGDKIKILLVTEAGAEGINIFEAQHIHILESSTREMKIQQAIGRVVRYRSHMVEGRKPMPKNEQVVHVWRYWSVSNLHPVTIKKPTGNVVITDKTAVDEILYNKGKIFINNIQSFLSLLKEASVTKYDKEQDKESMGTEQPPSPIHEEIEKACKISDERFNKLYSDLLAETDIESVIEGAREDVGNEESEENENE